MASVTQDMLNQRQVLNLTNKNRQWLREGLIPDDGKLYHHCNRCEDLGIAPRFKPVEEFTFHGSKSDGCSTYCTKCTSVKFNKEQAAQALQLMQDALVPAITGELLLEDDGIWKPASSFKNPVAKLNENLSKPKPVYPEVEDLSFDYRQLGFVALMLAIFGGVAWVLS